MLDFVEVAVKSPNRSSIVIYPNFIVRKSKDLMIKGGDFYAVWVEDIGLWSTDEDDLIRLVDRQVSQFYEENKHRYEGFSVSIQYLRNGSSGMIDIWHKYCQRQCRDNFRMLNEKLVFANSPTNKEDYASIRLPYALEEGPCPAWEEIVSTLYEPEERHKIEWSIGSIITGDSKKNQKFLVFYGPKGTGKSTIINIIEELFQGYTAPFEAKALGNGNASFALEPFKNGPLVGIQHDGNLSKIEDNARLNSLISHELMTINEKFKSLYSNAFKTFLILGTNEPVRITNAKSGILRRLIDVYPSEHLIPRSRYDILMERVRFELGAIAWHCMTVYQDCPNYYDNYVPINMMGATNDFYNFVEDSYLIFEKEDSVTLGVAWEMYKDYCDDAKVPYPLSKRAFKEELKNYFWDFAERSYTDDGRLRNIYSGFRKDKFGITDLETLVQEQKKILEKPKWLNFNCTESLLDKLEAECPAQYASSKETPSMPWDEVITKLKDLDTSRLHYVMTDITHIVIDFDIPDENGNKSFEKNYEAALKWPPTYAELSKSGQGIHLHYIYKGDPTELESIYAPHIEVKVFKGKSALRRKLTKCNDIPVASISSGLPIKEKGGKMLNEDAVMSEKKIRAIIAKGLRREISPGATVTTISFIKKILDEAYEAGIVYDVSSTRTALTNFAADSTNHSRECLKMVMEMKLKSDTDTPVEVKSDDEDLYFFDIEVFPNLLLINYKKKGSDIIYRMINPKPDEVLALTKKKLIGYNCRRYDNHILHARIMGATNEEIYQLSKRIIAGEKGCFYGPAYDYSYTDIYDFASSGNKMSLKKLEIQMGIHHQELGFDWDQPVPEDKWQEVSEYCDNDVIATEAAFEYLKSDFLAREILAALVGGKVNDTTNSLTTKLIFENNKEPQGKFCYRDLSKPVEKLDLEVEEFLKETCPDMMSVTHTNDGLTMSELPYFPGYKYEFGKSTYKGFEVGEGGFVYAEPGTYTNVALLDVASMHPHSMISECIFGVKYTKVLYELVKSRVAIKHKDWDKLSGYLEGKLVPFIEDVKSGKISAKALANALKTAINSIYGLTAARFENAFRDKRNIDNIVAKRGALFMIDLKEFVERKGFTVAHIKTDSIKIPNATPEIIKEVMEFGKMYGYTFEHEATYDRMCLVNNAVYIAKYANAPKCEKFYGYLPGDNADAIENGMMWTATGAQFAVPFVFKKLFSNEPLIFEDYCETKSVAKGALYLNDHFIGRVGQFCPMKEDVGMDLLCLRDEKFVAPSGTKDYKWMESEQVRLLKMQDSIDISYYENLANAAVEELQKNNCNFEAFISDADYPFEFTTEYRKHELVPVEQTFMNPPVSVA